MSNDDPRKPRVEHPRVPPEIIPPRGRAQQRGFDSLFIRVEEGDDGIRRVHLKKPGPFTIILVLLAAGAVAALFFLLLADDYSVKYVQRHSDASMPWYYKLTAFWGGLDGSIMWWVLLLALFSAVAIFVNRERHRELIPYVTAVLFSVVGFFLLLIIYEKRPFDVDADGRSRDVGLVDVLVVRALVDAQRTDPPDGDSPASGVQSLDPETP